MMENRQIDAKYRQKRLTKEEKRFIMKNKKEKCSGEMINGIGWIRNYNSYNASF
jgi:hypothetical protein